MICGNGQAVDKADLDRKGSKRVMFTRLGIPTWQYSPIKCLLAMDWQGDSHV